MGFFDDIVPVLWQAFGQDGPPPSGHTATLRVDGIDVRLTDRGRFLLVRAAAGPVAAGEPHRSMQIRGALQLTFGSLRRHPVLVHVKKENDQQQLLVEKKINYTNSINRTIEKHISHIIKLSHTLKVIGDDDADTRDQNRSPNYSDDESIENEVVFRI